MNQFILHLKLIKIDEETGKAFAPPCEFPMQFACHLDAYLKDFMRDECGHPSAYKTAIDRILRVFYGAWKTPIGWGIEMQSRDDSYDFLNESLPEEIRQAAFDAMPVETRLSDEFSYSPAHGQPAVDISFLWDWAVERQQREARGEV